MKNRAAYLEDFDAWLREQAELVRSGDLDLLDRENVAEELEGMSRSERHALSSHLLNVMLHMLKLEFQPARRNRSLLQSIRNGRREAFESVRTSPSLKREIEGIMHRFYRYAREDAADETRLSIKRFPEEPPFTLAQVLGDEPFPPEEEFRRARKK